MKYSFKTTIGGETRTVTLNNGTLYRLEAAGGSLTDIQRQPVKTVIELVYHGLDKAGKSYNSPADVADAIEDLQQLVGDVTAAMDGAFRDEPEKKTGG